MSASIMIEDLDATILARLEAEARRRGVTPSVIARDALLRGLRRCDDESGERQHHDLDALAGTWTDAEADEFLQASADFSRTDPDLWK